MMNMIKMVSPSRTYVAMCNKHDFTGFYFRKFKLPERGHSQYDQAEGGQEIENNAEKASWYFLNRIDFVACIEGCFPAENFADVKEVE